jgi:hypothetical protein
MYEQSYMCFLSFLYLFKCKIVLCNQKPVATGFWNFAKINEPVAVPVSTQIGEKPDLTGPSNTKRSERGYCTGILQTEAIRPSHLAFD